MRRNGFTLVELIVTMIIVGIMAVVAFPRLTDLNVFDAAGFADQIQSVVRYAQKTSIAQRRSTAVTFATNGASLCSYTGATLPCAANCAFGTNVANLALPGGAFRPAGAGTGMAGGTLCFDATGRPYQGGAALAVPLSIVVTDNGTILRSIVVEPETGYVR